jgi:23S rRNA (pseudouridine1915-N3)-methyltransferase
MKIKIISVGKLKEKYLKIGIDEYLKRLTSYANVEVLEVNDEKAPENLSEKELVIIKNTEGRNILTRIHKDDYVIALAIEGKMISSEELSIKLNNYMTYGQSKICLVIGGSNGLSDEVYLRANELISFSKMTFPHQLMRLILLEQIYRAFRIIKNEPYHK